MVLLVIGLVLILLFIAGLFGDPPSMVAYLLGGGAMFLLPGAVLLVLGVRRTSRGRRAAAEPASGQPSGRVPSMATVPDGAAKREDDNRRAAKRSADMEVEDKMQRLLGRLRRTIGEPFRPAGLTDDGSELITIWCDEDLEAYWESRHPGQYLWLEDDRSDYGPPHYYGDTEPYRYVYSIHPVPKPPDAVRKRQEDKAARVAHDLRTCVCPTCIAYRRAHMTGQAK